MRLPRVVDHREIGGPGLDLACLRIEPPLRRVGMVLECLAKRPQIDRLQIEHVISFIKLEQADLRLHGLLRPPPVRTRQDSRERARMEAAGLEPAEDDLRADDSVD